MTRIGPRGLGAIMLLSAAPSACGDPPAPVKSSATATAATTATVPPSAVSALAPLTESRRRTGGPHVRVGAAQITGDILHEPLHRAFRQSLSDLRSCYDAGLKKNPQLKGRVIFTLTIDEAGSTKDLKSDPDMKDAAVVDCAEKVIAGVKLPKPKAGQVSVRYPILFSPGDAINGKAPKDATRADVEKALVEAGATEVAAKPKEGLKDVSVITGKSGATPFTITFFPASAVEKLDDKAIAEAETKGFVYADEGMVLAVESSVIAESERLLRIVVKER